MDTDEQVKHPGWGIKFYGDWMGHAHGWSPVWPSIADVYSSKAEALKMAADILEYYGNKPEDIVNCEVLEAWEPLVASLQHDISMLTKANRISPDKLFQLRMSLSDLKSDLDDVELEFKSLLSE